MVAAGAHVDRFRDRHFVVAQVADHVRLTCRNLIHVLVVEVLVNLIRRDPVLVVSFEHLTTPFFAGHARKPAAADALERNRLVQLLLLVRRLARCLNNFSTLFLFLSLSRSNAGGD